MGAVHEHYLELFRAKSTSQSTSSSREHVRNETSYLPDTGTTKSKNANVDQAGRDDTGEA